MEQTGVLYTVIEEKPLWNSFPEPANAQYMCALWIDLPNLKYITNRIRYTHVHQTTCTRIFLVALFLIAQDGSNPNILED